jgi:alpha-D-ribose 1-methylphosphonate 5-triphosphate synthase subunit PhnG
MASEDLRIERVEKASSWASRRDWRNVAGDASWAEMGFPMEMTALGREERRSMLRHESRGVSMARGRMGSAKAQSVRRW